MQGSLFGCLSSLSFSVRSLEFPTTNFFVGLQIGRLACQSLRLTSERHSRPSLRWHSTSEMPGDRRVNYTSHQKLSGGGNGAAVSTTSCRAGSNLSPADLCGPSRGPRCKRGFVHMRPDDGPWRRMRTFRNAHAGARCACSCRRLRLNPIWQCNMRRSSFWPTPACCCLLAALLLPTTPSFVCWTHSIIQADTRKYRLSRLNFCPSHCPLLCSAPWRSWRTPPRMALAIHLSPLPLPPDVCSCRNTVTTPSHGNFLHRSNLSSHAAHAVQAVTRV